MAFDWEPYYRKILALSAQDYSHAEIAQYVTEASGENITRDMARHALERARESVPQLTEMPQPQRVPYIDRYREYVTGFKKPEPKDWDAVSRALNKSNCKVLVHSDLHIPFHDEVRINDSINKHIDADVYAGVADIMDCYSQSVFMKTQDMPFVFEVDETLRVLEYLSNAFEVVLLLEANHEDRVRKRIAHALPAELQFLTESHILSRLAAPFPNVIVHNDLWFFQFGSVLFTHPEKASRVELRAAVAVYEHFQEWSTSYGLKPWNCIVVAHTHQSGVAYTADTKVLEIGCLSKPMGYAYSPRIPYKRPHSVGYAVLKLDKGLADLNSCREYKYWGAQTYDAHAK